MRPDAVLATNTSSLSVDALGRRGSRIPSASAASTSSTRSTACRWSRWCAARDLGATLVTAVALARRLGKTPVVVADAPGFVVNRVLMPYLREAMHLLEEGYPIADIDAAMRRFGMPMGPFEVRRRGRARRGAKVGGRARARRSPTACRRRPRSTKLVAAGRLGKKSGLGFYRHRGGKRRARSRSCASCSGCRAQRDAAEPRRALRAHGAGDDQRERPLPRGRGRGGRRRCSTWR